MNHSSVESISEEVAKTLSDNSKKISDSKDNMKTDILNIGRPRMDSIQDAEDTKDAFKNKGSPNEDKKVTKTESFTGTNQDGYKEKSGKHVDKESDGIMRSEDEDSKSGIHFCQKRFHSRQKSRLLNLFHHKEKTKGNQCDDACMSRHI